MTEWADDIEDHEYPEPDDYDDDESTETIQCPECRDWVYVEAVTCPSCGFFFTDQSRRSQERPQWWTWVIILIIVSFVASFVLL